jgi:hypothetical protein
VPTSLQWNNATDRRLYMTHLSGTSMSKPVPLTIRDRRTGEIFAEWLDDAPSAYETRPLRSLGQWLESQPLLTADGVETIVRLGEQVALAALTALGSRARAPGWDDDRSEA